MFLGFEAFICFRRFSIIENEKNTRHEKAENDTGHGHGRDQALELSCTKYQKCHTHLFLDAAPLKINQETTMTDEKTWTVRGKSRIGTSNCWNDELVIAEGLSSHEAADAVAAASVSQGGIQIRIFSVPITPQDRKKA